MTSTSATKVRVVLCPKCSQFLPERADVPVYKCGGCGTILQAKKRQAEMENQVPSLQDAGLHRNEMKQISGDVASGSTSQVASPPTEWHSVDSKDDRNQNDSSESYMEECAVGDLSCEEASSAELKHYENEEPSLPAKVNTIVHENNNIGHDLRPSEGVCAVETRERSTTGAPARSSNESNSPEDFCNLESGQPQGCVFDGSDDIGPPNTLEPTELVNPSSELRGALQNFSKSSANGSSHAYDGSVSSYDGNDDQVPDQNLLSKTSKVLDIYDTKKRHVGNRRPVTDNSRRERHAWIDALTSSDKKLHGMRNTSCEEANMQEPPKCSHPVRSRVRLEREEYWSRLPFPARGSHSSSEFGDPYRQGRDEFRYSSSFESAEKYNFNGEDKMKLLRMVWELQDELKRRVVLDGKEDERVSSGLTWKEKQIPAYCNYCKVPDNEICNASYCPQCPGPERLGRVKDWPHRGNLPRKSFSGEAANSRLQFSHSCSHSCPHDWRWSVQLLPPCVNCNREPSRAHDNYGCCSVSTSAPSGPLEDMDTELLHWRHGSKSGDLRPQDHRVSSHFREESQLKRHIRPVVGGAPFVTCYCCLAMLQLPADFLLFKRRCHRLRCSACSEVLMFSLENRTHIVPHSSTIVTGPPPTEVGDDSGAVNNRTIALSSHASSCSHADPVSCSDDYGLSLCKSCSQESKEDHHFQGNAENGKISNGSFERGEDRKEMETNESDGSSSIKPRVGKVSSEIEELPSSPLHQLMGYSSPTDVINVGNHFR